MVVFFAFAVKWLRLCVFVAVCLCFCGGVVVFLCFRGCVFVVAWWCFWGGAVVPESGREEFFREKRCH